MAVAMECACIYEVDAVVALTTITWACFKNYKRWLYLQASDILHSSAQSAGDPPLAMRAEIAITVASEYATQGQPRA